MDRNGATWAQCRKQRAKNQLKITWAVCLQHGHTLNRSMQYQLLQWNRQTKENAMFDQFDLFTPCITKNYAKPCCASIGPFFRHLYNRFCLAFVGSLYMTSPSSLKLRVWARFWPLWSCICIPHIENHAKYIKKHVFLHVFAMQAPKSAKWIQTSLKWG